MAGSLRHSPPELRAHLIERSAAQAVLRRRFDRPVTVVNAGAGFGKTTALAHAVEENRIDPLGDDRWLRCEPADADAAHLAHGIARCFGVRPRGSAARSLDAAIEAINGLAPSEVCLLLDDVHRVPVGSDGATLLAELAQRSPANLHVVLCGRGPPPIAIAGFEARGRSVEIGEDELALTADHVSQLAAELGYEPPDVGRLGGWPALVDVALRSGRPQDALIETVLDELDDHARAQLFCVVAASEVDASVVADVCGFADERSLESLPLVDRRDGRYVAHDLWHELLSPTPEVAAIRPDVARALLDAGRAIAAVDVVLDAVAGDDEPPTGSAERQVLLDLLVDCAVGALRPEVLPGGDVLRRWRRALPTDAPAPVRHLVDGLVLRLDTPAATETVEALSSAAAGFNESGNVRAEAIALSTLNYPLHVRRDRDGLVASYTRLVELASAGVGEAEQQRILAGAVVANSRGELQQVKEILRPLVEQADGLPRPAAALWLYANALNGLCEPSLEYAEALVATGTKLPGFSVAVTTAHWRRGDIEWLLANPLTPADGARDQFLAAVWSFFATAETGDLETAARHLEVVRRADGTEASIAAEGSVPICEAAFSVEHGDDADAAARLRAMLADHPIDGPSRGYYVMSTGLFYPLLPEHRDFFDGLDLGPLYHRDLAVAQAWVALVEADDPGPLRSLRLPDRAGEMIPALGLRHVAEVLSAAVELGVDRAEEVVGELVAILGERARLAIRRAADHEHPTIARGATSVIASIPVPPPDTIDLRLLGTCRLEVGGRESTSADWRRERVRALVAFMALHPSPTREVAIAALWPDADADSGRQNLRATLNRLHRALEPGRTSGDAPFFVRSTGQLLRLVTDDRMAIDVGQFRAAVDEAERLEADGMPSKAIAPYLAAIDRYGGDLLPDSYDDWVMVQRDVLRTTYVRAAVRCSELLTAVGRIDDAIGVSSDLLTIEPLSESGHRTLVAAHLAAGEHAAAHRAMATCERLLEQIGGITETETMLLRRRIRGRAS